MTMSIIWNQRSKKNIEMTLLKNKFAVIKEETVQVDLEAIAIKFAVIPEISQ